MSAFGDLVADGVDPVILEQFGDEITYYPAAGDEYTITVVLDSGTELQQQEKVYQTAWAPISSFTAGEPAKGDRVEIDSRTYRVADVEKQHLGGRLLKLALTQP